MDQEVFETEQMNNVSTCRRKSRCHRRECRRRRFEETWRRSSTGGGESAPGTTSAFPPTGVIATGFRSVAVAMATRSGRLSHNLHVLWHHRVANRSHCLRNANRVLRASLDGTTSATLSSIHLHPFIRTGTAIGTNQRHLQIQLCII